MPNLDKPSRVATRPRRIGRRGALLFAGAWMGMATTHVAAGNRPAERIEPGLLHLRTLDGYLDFETTIDQVRVRSEDGADRVNARQVNRSAITRTMLGLRFSGDIIHPYLVDFSGSVGVGYTESRFREETLRATDSDRATGFLHEFDVRASFLKTKPMSGSMYGLRHEERIGRLFLPTLRELRTSYGTTWTSKSATLPLNLRYDHVNTDRTGNRAHIDDEQIIEDRLRFDGEWRIGEYHRLAFDYEHSRLQQEHQGTNLDFDTRRNQLQLRHEIEFGVDHENRLDTLLRIQEESGDLAEDIFEIRPELFLEHSPTLSTRYAYSFRREEFDAFDVDLHRFDFALTHRFLMNLTTVVDVFGLQERTSDGIETTQGGASIDWHYTRSNPYGQLSADLGLAADSERTRGNNGLRAVRNESGTFRDPLPLYLTNRNPAAASILVTDASGTVVYRGGTDYTLVRTRDRIGLYRLPAGRITDGQTVLVDYRYRTPVGGKIDTLRVDFNVQQEFSWGLAPYYRLSYRNQEVDASSGFAFLADRTDHHRLGLRLTKPRWSLHGEYEVFDDTIEPYDAFHVGGGLEAVRSDRQALDLRADFSWYSFEGGWDARDVSEVHLSTRYDYRINERWATGLSSAYRWEDDSKRGITRGLDLEGTLSYQRGNMSLELSLEYDLLRIDESKEDGVAAWLRMRWDVVDLLGRG